MKTTPGKMRRILIEFWSFLNNPLSRFLECFISTPFCPSQALFSPLHFIGGTIDHPRNNRIKIHILQTETQLQTNFISRANLY